MAPDGSGMSGDLRAVRDSIADIPMDDAAAEGPRAQGPATEVKSPAGTWARIASSMRMRQALSRVETRAAAFDCSLQSLWDRGSSVLQVERGATGARPRRMAWKRLVEALYTMDHFDDFVLGDPDQDEEGNEDEDEDGDDDGASDGDGAACRHSDALPPEDARDPGEARLLDEYYTKAFEGHLVCYMSFPSPSCEKGVCVPSSRVAPIPK